MVRLEGSGKEEVVSEVRDEEGEKRRWRSGKGGEAKDGGSSESAWH